ncbi:MAG: hypothetical protein ACFFFG_12085 [Candidatus Thorarchaeota archaeon]
MFRSRNYDAMKQSFDKIDTFISKTMNDYGIILLRISFGIVFIWFGILKPLGLSPAETLASDLVAQAGYWIPLNEYLYPLLALVEVSIGILFLFRPTLRIAIFLLAIQMPLTFMPLIVLPAATWVTFPIVPTLEGQYIIKNLILVSAAIVVGGTVRKSQDKQ